MNHESQRCGMLLARLGVFGVIHGVALGLLQACASSAAIPPPMLPRTLSGTTHMDNPRIDPGMAFHVRPDGSLLVRLARKGVACTRRIRVTGCGRPYRSVQTCREPARRVYRQSIRDCRVALDILELITPWGDSVEARVDRDQRAHFVIDWLRTTRRWGIGNERARIAGIWKIEARTGSGLVHGMTQWTPRAWEVDLMVAALARARPAPPQRFQVEVRGTERGALASGATSALQVTVRNPGRRVASGVMITTQSEVRQLHDRQYGPLMLRPGQEHTFRIPVRLSPRHKLERRKVVVAVRDTRSGDPATVAYHWVPVRPAANLPKAPRLNVSCAVRSGSRASGSLLTPGVTARLVCEIANDGGSSARGVVLHLVRLVGVSLSATRVPLRGRLGPSRRVPVYLLLDPPRTVGSCEKASFTARLTVDGTTVLEQHYCLESSAVRAGSLQGPGGDGQNSGMQWVQTVRR